MSAETLHSEGDNGREADGFEKENDVEHGNTGVSFLGSGRADEDDAQAHKDKENPSWLHKTHDTTSGESANGKGSLSTGEQLGAETAGSAWSGRYSIVDETTGNCNLSTSVAKLSKSGVEESVLLPEWFVI